MYLYMPMVWSIGVPSCVPLRRVENKGREAIYYVLRCPRKEAGTASEPETRTETHRDREVIHNCACRDTPDKQTAR